MAEINPAGNRDIKATNSVRRGGPIRTDYKPPPKKALVVSRKKPNSSLAKNFLEKINKINNLLIVSIKKLETLCKESAKVIKPHIEKAKKQYQAALKKTKQVIHITNKKFKQAVKQAIASTQASIRKIKTVTRNAIEQAKTVAKQVKQSTHKSIKEITNKPSTNTKKTGKSSSTTPTKHTGKNVVGKIALGSFENHIANTLESKLNKLNKPKTQLEEHLVKGSSGAAAGFTSQVFINAALKVAKPTKIFQDTLSSAVTGGGSTITQKVIRDTVPNNKLSEIGKDIADIASATVSGAVVGATIGAAIGAVGGPAGAGAGALSGAIENGIYSGITETIGILMK